jgi:hypothetical protein
MRALKPFLFLLATTVIVIALIAWSLDAFGLRSPAFAFLINWLAMSWGAVASLAIRFSFAPNYYAIKSFEQTGRVYEWLGVRLVKKILRRGPLAILSPTLRFPEEKTVAGLEKLENEMRNAETIHLYVFIFILLLTGFALLNGWLDAVGWLSLFNILFNIYPIMLQRYNRIRMQETFHLRE